MCFLQQIICGKRRLFTTPFAKCVEDKLKVLSMFCSNEKWSGKSRNWFLLLEKF